jgi:hypothetical protein
MTSSLMLSREKVVTRAGGGTQGSPGGVTGLPWANVQEIVNLNLSIGLKMKINRSSAG